MKIYSSKTIYCQRLSKLRLILLTIIAVVDLCPSTKNTKQIWRCTSAGLTLMAVHLELVFQLSLCPEPTGRKAGGVPTTKVWINTIALISTFEIPTLESLTCFYRRYHSCSRATESSLFHQEKRWSQARFSQRPHALGRLVAWSDWIYESILLPKGWKLSRTRRRASFG